MLLWYITKAVHNIKCMLYNISQPSRCHCSKSDWQPDCFSHWLRLIIACRISVTQAGTAASGPVASQRYPRRCHCPSTQFTQEAPAPTLGWCPALAIAAGRVTATHVWMLVAPLWCGLGCCIPNNFDFQSHCNNPIRWTGSSNKKALQVMMPGKNLNYLLIMSWIVPLSSMIYKKKKGLGYHCYLYQNIKIYSVIVLIYDLVSTMAPASVIFCWNYNSISLMSQMML